MNIELLYCSDISLENFCQSIFLTFFWAQPNVNFWGPLPFFATAPLSCQGSWVRPRNTTLAARWCGSWKTGHQMLLGKAEGYWLCVKKIVIFVAAHCEIWTNELKKYPLLVLYIRVSKIVIDWPWMEATPAVCIPTNTACDCAYIAWKDCVALAKWNSTSPSTTWVHWYPRLTQFRDSSEGTSATRTSCAAD